MTDSDLPLALYKANLDLWLRLGELLQDSREQWMQLLAREVRDGILEVRTETEQAQQAEGWQSLSVLPGSALWRIAEQQMGDLQALVQTAVGNQMTFANGFQHALAEWQEATAGAIGGAAGVQPGSDLLERTLQALSALAPGMTGIPGSATAATAARKGQAGPTAARARPGRDSGTASGTAAPKRKRATRAGGAAAATKAAKRPAKRTAKATPKAAGKTPGNAAKKAAKPRPAKRAPKKAAARRSTAKARK